MQYNILKRINAKIYASRQYGIILQKICKWELKIKFTKLQNKNKNV